MNRIYYGYNVNEKRVMFATISGQMSDGTMVYTECNGYGVYIDTDKQYTRHTKYGQQVFFRL